MNLPFINAVVIFSLFLSATAQVVAADNTFPDSGNVGIGTTSPTAKLHVNGAIKTNANRSGERRIWTEAPANGNHRGDGSQPATGLVYRVENNPADGAPIFQVRSANQGVRLFVEHDGWTGATSNSAWFGGSRPNYFASKVAIGNKNPGAFKLYVDGKAKVEKALQLSNGIQLSDMQENTRSHFLDLVNTKSQYVGDRTGIRLCGNSDCSFGGKIYSQAGYLPLIIEAMDDNKRVEVRNTLAAKNVQAANVCVSGDCRSNWPDVNAHWKPNGNHIHKMVGRVGIGVKAPKAELHIRRALTGPRGYTSVRVENKKGNNKGAQIELINGDDTQVQYNLGVGGDHNGNTVEDKFFVWKQNADGSAGDLLLTLDRSGVLKVHSVVVTQKGWSDYVFDDNYALPSIEDVAAFIETEKHLPGVPSAKQVAHEGVSLGEMDATLLRKVEELTLYQIELNKLLKEMKAEVEQLKVQNRQLKGELLRGREAS